MNYKDNKKRQFNSRTVIYGMIVAGTKNYTDKEFSENRHTFEALKPLATGTYHNEKYDKIMNYKVVII